MSRSSSSRAGAGFSPLSDSTASPAPTRSSASALVKGLMNDIDMGRNIADDKAELVRAKAIYGDDFISALVACRAATKYGSLFQSDNLRDPSNTDRREKILSAMDRLVKSRFSDTPDSSSKADLSASRGREAAVAKKRDMMEGLLAALVGDAGSSAAADDETTGLLAQRSPSPAASPR